MSKHLDLVIPFLRTYAPDVLCVQELNEADIPLFESVVGPVVRFAPATVFPSDPPLTYGVALFSRLPVRESVVHYYAGSEEGARTKPPHRSAEDSALVIATFEKEGVLFRIGTLHFTWTFNGQPNDEQRRDLEVLLPILEREGELVFCGDLNAPRGGEIFGTFAKRYTDNIPSRYTWSLDLTKHRSGGGKIEADARAAGFVGFMVDGLFSTPSYRVSNVELVSGVSDHCAIVAEVTKV